MYGFSNSKDPAKYIRVAGQPDLFWPHDPLLPVEQVRGRDEPLLGLAESVFLLRKKKARNFSYVYAVRTTTTVIQYLVVRSFPTGNTVAWACHMRFWPTLARWVIAAIAQG